MEDFLIRFSQDPRRFYSLLEAQLEPNEYAHTDFQLRRLLGAITGSAPDERLRETITSLRAAQSAAATDQAMSVLRAHLANGGFVLYHSFITAVSTRVIRPGSTRMRRLPRSRRTGLGSGGATPRRRIGRPFHRLSLVSRRRDRSSSDWCRHPTP